MDGPRDDHTNEVSPVKTIHDITYMWNLKYDTNQSIYEAETDSQT